MILRASPVAKCLVSMAIRMSKGIRGRTVGKHCLLALECLNIGMLPRTDRPPPQLMLRNWLLDRGAWEASKLSILLGFLQSRSENMGHVQNILCPMAMNSLLGRNPCATGTDPHQVNDPIPNPSFDQGTNGPRPTPTKKALLSIGAPTVFLLVSHYHKRKRGSPLKNKIK